VRDVIGNASLASWFLHFKPGGAFPNGSYNVPPCDDNYKPPLCSTLYHDQVCGSLVACVHRPPALPELKVYSLAPCVGVAAGANAAVPWFGQRGRLPRPL
jgi:hypothetical protein